MKRSSRATTGPAGRIGVEDKSAALGQLGRRDQSNCSTIWSSAARGCKDREQLFQRLVETVHDAVLVHRDTIVFANARFLAMLGMSAAEVDRPAARAISSRRNMSSWWTSNLRRRLAGEPAAERYEVELVGKHGEVTRVELSSTIIDSGGEPALLLTALEMLPNGRSRARRRRGRARW